MIIQVISVAALVSAVLCILGKYKERPNLIYVFKPLTTALIIVVAVLSGTNNVSVYLYVIIGALFFSLLGDIFLMLDDSKFLYGLISFLTAHILFLVAFLFKGVFFTWWIVLIAVLIGGTLYMILYPSLGKMKIPVLIYVTIIFAMTWAAWENQIQINNQGTLLAALGTLFFVVSDSNLAFNKFVKKYKPAEFIVLSTYFLSIWLIALSTSF